MTTSVTLGSEQKGHGGFANKFAENQGLELWSCSDNHGMLMVGALFESLHVAARYYRESNEPEAKLAQLLFVTNKASFLERF